MRFAFVQFHPQLGDIAANGRALKGWIECAIDNQCDGIFFPELSISGHQPKDLLNHYDFINQHHGVLDSLKSYTNSILIGLGALTSEKTKYSETYYSGFHLWQKDSRPLVVQDVKIMEHQGLRIGFCLCPDIWGDECMISPSVFKASPIWDAIRLRCNLLIILGNSRFEIGKPDLRKQMLQKIATTHDQTLLFLNQVGLQDLTIYDGGSMLIQAGGEIHLELPLFQEDFAIFEWNHDGQDHHFLPAPKPISNENLHNRTNEAEPIPALMAGLHDFLGQCLNPSIIIPWQDPMATVFLLVLLEKMSIQKQVHLVVDRTILVDPFWESWLLKWQTLLVYPIQIQEISFLSVWDLADCDENSCILYTTTKTEIALTDSPFIFNRFPRLAVFGDLYYSHMMHLFHQLFDSTDSKIKGWQPIFEWLSEAHKRGKYLPWIHQAYQKESDRLYPSKRLPSAMDIQSIDAILSGYLELQKDETDLSSEGYSTELISWIQTVFHRTISRQYFSHPILQLTGNTLFRDLLYPYMHQFKK